MLNPNEIEELLKKAKDATKHSYAPYSNFHVGAAILTRDNNIYTGTNIENASYGLTICAERVAVFKAVSNGEREFKAIVIYAEGEMPYPCGACRQVLAEFDNGDMEVIVTNGEKIEKYTLRELLPKTFQFKRG